MPKTNIIYACSNCGAQSPKWTGRCLECGAWGSLREETQINNRGNLKTTDAAPAETINLNDVKMENWQRIKTGLDEFDRVLGGGIVPGSLILVGGEPGIGKSTLMLQITPSPPNPYPSGRGETNVSERGEGTLYVSGEESAQQIKSRMERLGIKNNLQFISETNVEKIISAIIKLKPQLVVVDSIQTIYSDEVPSEPGGVNQIRACAVKLLPIAKEKNIPIIITGHITKDGSLAGPKTLEHLVDTVAYLEQPKNKEFRLLRAVKNRFGSTNEVGLFEMSDAGFKEVRNPSGVFLDKQEQNSGTAVSCIMEGTRPFLIEVQALITRTVFGYPQRKASGFDLNRLQILIAVLTKRAGLNLTAQDAHINVVGGLKTNETALDLAVCAAIISSLTNQTLAGNTVILGEVGLGGEVRNVYKLEQRLAEAAKLGFKKAVIPDVKINSGLELIQIKNVKNLAEYIV
ncbi:MAG: DNA repair protein RadA [Patescibacteria group bacterium]|jgi:DNA repair protein RadA/Sms